MVAVEVVPEAGLLHEPIREQRSIDCSPLQGLAADGSVL
jgi:hypothetical protein